jgi:large subunit ribosomal protein L13
MKTFSAKSHEVVHEWFVIDATDKGGISSTNFDKMQDRFPGRALEKAVKGMLPKGPLGYAMIKKLKVYGDASHPHAAQQPKALEI